MFNTMNTIRPRQYPQANGNYTAGNGETDKDGQNQNAQDQNRGQQNRQTVARGRVEDVQNQAPRVYSPAANAYAQAYPTRQSYQVTTPPPIRHVSPNQINPMQYQAAQAGYQPIQQQPAPQAVPTTTAGMRSNKINIA